MNALFKKLRDSTQFKFLSFNRQSTSNTSCNKLQSSSNCKQNQALFIIPYLTFVFFVVDLLHGRGSIIINLVGCFVCILIGVSKLISISFSQEFYSLFYNLLLGLYSVHFSYMGNGGNAISAWLGVLFFPIVIYLLTKNFGHFLVQTALQLLWLNTLYQSQIERIMIMETPEELRSSLTSSLHFVAMVNLVFIAIMHHFSYNNNKILSSSNDIKNGVEQQKNFLLGFSHELRNHINGLMGNIKLTSFEQIPEKVKDLLSNAELCGELLLLLITNVLDMGKAEINELEVSSDPTRIFDIIEGSWKVCSELIQSKNLKGRMRIQKNIPKVLKIDYYRLRQILLNLVENSVKFTASGLIDVSVEWIRNANHVTERCFEPYPFNEENDQDEGIFEKKQAFTVFNEDFEVFSSPYVKMKKESLFTNEERNRGVLKISVTDSGCGISREKIPSLFERLAQGSDDRRRPYCGLGLFITRKICEKMNGKIQVYSKKGKGSSFIVCIPIDPIPTEVNPLLRIDTMKDILTPKNLKAMVVDDKFLNISILRDFLVRLGIEVVEIAENGKVAYEKYTNNLARGKELNIVTMDLDMPVMNGKIAAQKIRELEENEGFDPCFLIITSGNCFQSEVQECMDIKGRIRANAFLKKPVSMEDLLRTMMPHFSSRNLSGFNRQGLV